MNLQPKQASRPASPLAAEPAPEDLIDVTKQFFARNKLKRIIFAKQIVRNKLKRIACTNQTIKKHRTKSVVLFKF